MTLEEKLNAIIEGVGFLLDEQVSLEENENDVYYIQTIDEGWWIDINWEDLPIIATVTYMAQWFVHEGNDYPKPPKELRHDT